MNLQLIGARGLPGLLSVLSARASVTVTVAARACTTASKHRELRSLSYRTLRCLQSPLMTLLWSFYSRCHSPHPGISSPIFAGRAVQIPIHAPCNLSRTVSRMSEPADMFFQKSRRNKGSVALTPRICSFLLAWRRLCVTMSVKPVQFCL